jgi:hypothetical protein
MKPSSLINQIDFYLLNFTKPFISLYQTFIMSNGSIKNSIESNDLLKGIKRYLRIEHQEDDKDLLDYLRKQAGLHRDK